MTTPRRLFHLCVLCAAATLSTSHAASASVCFGTVAKGRLANGVQLPKEGANFQAYSKVGVQLGRNYVHAAVRDIVVEAYAGAAAATPGVRFVYGETGFAAGGRFQPHRSHQAGLSVDFMVPVRDAAGKPQILPAGVTNQFGYAWEFDDMGRAGGYRIDFEAVGEHLYQLSLASKRRGIPIKRVIFDPPLTALLLKTRRGPDLAASIRFMKERPWIRHDEHYHVDFDIPCQPLANIRQGTFKLHAARPGSRRCGPQYRWIVQRCDVAT